jgi:SAM-dependent methyltransferase
VFDLVTGVETHFWWPDLPGGVREVFRVLKPGGMLVLIAEVYRGLRAKTEPLVQKSASPTGMKLLSVESIASSSRRRVTRMFGLWLRGAKDGSVLWAEKRRMREGYVADVAQKGVSTRLSVAPPAENPPYRR